MCTKRFSVIADVQVGGSRLVQGCPSLIGRFTCFRPIDLACVGLYDKNTMLLWWLREE